MFLLVSSAPAQLDENQARGFICIILICIDPRLRWNKEDVVDESGCATVRAASGEKRVRRQESF